MGEPTKEPCINSNTVQKVLGASKFVFVFVQVESELHSFDHVSCEFMTEVSSPYVGEIKSSSANLHLAIMSP